MGRRRSAHPDIGKKKQNVLENLEGSIERWFAPRGYGFIEIPGKGDVFVHVNDIVGLSSADALNYSIWGHSLQGSKVRFSVVETVRGYKAKNVEITQRPMGDQNHLPPQNHQGLESLQVRESPREAGQVAYNVIQHSQQGQPEHMHAMLSHGQPRTPMHAVPALAPHSLVLPGALHNIPPGVVLRKLGHGELRPHSTSPPLPREFVTNPLHDPSLGSANAMNNARMYPQQDAYSSMCRHKLAECVPRDIHFYNHIVDQIIEFAGSISLSLISFNNNASPLSGFPAMSGMVGPLATLSYARR